ncbi:Fe2+-dependent dioxygenase [Chelatococcus sp. SYSU_G07232]|uniref:Fe2+-dependent dioxygenase n=1 Tax=Chelatococcus albus TaxID=3047466 RepID=A0ABT7AC61_9HYPH|nr:Fe2+-dependent dioxygenase [Chelatococcus sp. SYSU_G07232]MDJ1156950.1 Fe2+-dependent dioxygenase [Chelatococcus sp. SYSU_G07232]
MLITIANVLSQEDVIELRDKLAALRFEDGRATAGWGAKLVKANQQMRDGVTARLLREEVAAKIRGHAVFDLAVRPRALTPLLFSRYGVGDAYGTHVDNPMMDGLRTDVSFTLFLSDPESDDGGELVIETPAGEDAVKLPAGHLVAYPSTTLHRVAEVTRGERLVAVGWAQSHIRDAARRELLFDLDTARRRLFDRHGKTEDFDLLAKTSANLMRMWAE